MISTALSINADDLMLLENRKSIQDPSRPLESDDDYGDGVQMTTLDARATATSNLLRCLTGSNNLKMTVHGMMKQISRLLNSKTSYQHDTLVKLNSGY